MVNCSFDETTPLISAYSWVPKGFGIASLAAARDKKGFLLSL